MRTSAKRKKSDEILRSVDEYIAVGGQTPVCPRAMARWLVGAGKWIYQFQNS